MKPKQNKYKKAQRCFGLFSFLSIKGNSKGEMENVTTIEINGRGNYLYRK